MDKENPPHSFTSEEDERRKKKALTQKASGRSRFSSPITKSGNQQKEIEGRDNKYDEQKTTEHSKENTTHAEKINPEKAAKDPRIQAIKAKQNKEQEVQVNAPSTEQHPKKEQHSRKTITPEKQRVIQRLVNKAKQLYHKFVERKQQKSQTNPELQKENRTNSKQSYLASKIARDTGASKSEKEQPEKLPTQTTAQKSILRGKIAKEGKVEKAPATKAIVSKNIKKAPPKTK